jgi:hypothetical protein
MGIAMTLIGIVNNSGPKAMICKKFVAESHESVSVVDMARQ